jgi:raffinose/stachyose/melibiose transport system substrate-binding protein
VGVVTVAVAALAGAAGTAATAATRTTTSSDLKVYALTSDRTGFQAVLAVYKKQHPDVNVKVTYADVTPYQSTLRTQLSAGTGADVFEVWPGNGNPGAIQVLAPYHFLADLSGQRFAKREPAGIKKVTHVGGKLYTVPLAISGLGPIYNMSVMGQLGASIPKTWDQVLALCDTAKSKGLAAYALGIQDSWVTQLIPYALVPSTVYRKNPGFDTQMRAGKATFAKSGWVTAENLYNTMNGHGCFQSNPLGTNYDTSLTMVSSNKAAAVVQGSWAFSPLRDQAKSTQFRMAPLPADNTPADTRMAGAPAAAFAVNAKTKNPEAMKFMTFLASAAAQNAFAKASGNLPAYSNSAYRADAGITTFVSYLKGGKTVPFMDQLWPNAKVQDAHLTGLQDLFAGKKSVADILKDMDKAYRAN